MPLVDYLVSIINYLWHGFEILSYIFKATMVLAKFVA